MDEKKASGTVTFPCPPDPVFDRWLEKHGQDWANLATQQPVKTEGSVLDEFFTQAIAKNISAQVEQIASQVHETHLKEGGLDYLKDLPDLTTVYAETEESKQFMLTIQAAQLAKMVCDQAQQTDLDQFEGPPLKRIAAAINYAAADWGHGQLAELVVARYADTQVIVAVARRDVYTLTLEKVE